jgi:hypothetical protein
MKPTLRGRAAIIGSGLSPVGRVPGRSPLRLAADATRAALADAGLEKGDLDGVLACSAFASPFHRFSVAVAEYLGIQPTFSNTLQVSGATAATLFHVAAAAIVGGLAETILVVGADSLLSGLTPDGALFHFFEVIRQLQGRGGERQVARAELGLVHALGAGFATQATTILGTEATL